MRLRYLGLLFFAFLLLAQDNDSMRRRNPISVRVKAPSRGLNTRLPSESADLFGPGDLHRTSVVSTNMRYEDGVLCNAPGYERVALNTALLTNMVAHWPFDEAAGIRRDLVGDFDLQYSSGFPEATAVTSAPGKLGNALVLGTWNFRANGDSFLPPGGSYTLCGWVNFSSVASSQTVFQAVSFLPPFGEVIGLHRAGTNLNFYVTDGGGNSDTVTSSVTLTTNTWYFFAARYDATNQFLSIRVNAVEDHHANGSYPEGIATINLALVFDTHSSFQTSVDSTSMWNRYLSNAELDYLYNSGSGRNYPFIGIPNLLFEGNQITAPNTPLVFGTSSDLFSIARSFTSDPRLYTATLTNIYTGLTTDPGFRWKAVDFYDKIFFAQHNNVPQMWVNGAAATQAAPGLAVNSTDQYSATSDDFEKYDGVTSFFSHLLYWRDDRLVWSDVNDFATFIPVAKTAASAVLTLNGSFTQPAVGSTVTVNTVEDVVALGLLKGQYIKLPDLRSGVTYYNFYSISSAVPTTGTQTFLVLKLLGTTGRTASALTVATAQKMFTVDANEAGTDRVVGANVNGKIFQVVPSGDYAYVFKEWSISSLQYVGQQSGTFFLRTEVVREGLLGRNSLVNLGNGHVIFLGHRELYDYQGGTQPTPVCRQFTRQLFQELDRTKLDEIYLYHRELRNEVWVLYPTAGGQKVLVWNYVEDSASLDDYDASLHGLVAAARTGWPVDPPWYSLPDSQTWANTDDFITWATMVLGGDEELTLLVSGSGEMLVHGTVFNRAGTAYTSLSETMDYDFGDPDLFKYVDVVAVGLQVKNPSDQVRTIYIQVGGRTSLDDDITWTDPFPLQVQGNANFTAKVNPGGSGRYLRLRFYSQDADVEWRVSSYEIHCRPGSTY